MVISGGILQVEHPICLVGVDLDERFVCTLNAPLTTAFLHGVVAVLETYVASL